MRRLVLVGAVLGMVVLAGCMGGSIDEEALAEDATYDWNTSADATANVSGSSYQAVYVIDGESSLEFYQRGDLGGEEPLAFRAIQFRYQNGTVVNASAINVTEADERTVVTLPARSGKFAYTAGTPSGDLFFPVVVNGSHEVILPPGARISVPIIGYAEPGGFEQSMEGDRVHIHWDTPNQDVISVSYYQQQDLYLFSGLLGLLAAIAGGGWLYFRYQLKGLASERESHGLDVDDER